MNNDGSLYGEVNLSLTSVEKIIETLGVVRPNAKFINLFYESEDNPRGAGKVYHSRFTFEEMSEIFSKGNFTQLSKDFWEAKCNENHSLCTSIFNQACSFIPIRSFA